MNRRTSSQLTPHPIPFPNRKRRRVRGFVKFFHFLFIFIFLNLSSEISFAFRNLGVPVKEGVSWGSYAGPGKTGRTDTIYISLGRYKESLSLLA
ncbi:MAG: hypothetical protein Q7V12_05755, partial [Deltaproteobacteria bacterium]|nr:hypothetical protein [Deltaproteobacteria bacterium]